MSFIQNLRIGTKLAVTSALTIALVALMIFLQTSGGTEVQRLSNAASGQQAIAQNAAEAKASVRGMQIGIRDILTSSSPAEMQKAVTYFGDRQTAALKFSEEMAKLSHSPENQKRIDRLTVLIGNFGKGEQKIEAIRKQELALDGKKDGEAAAEHARLAAEVSRIRKETLAPINEEISELTNEIINLAKQSSTAARAEAEAEATSVARVSLITGVLVALVLIGACIFSVFSIARPMRALTSAMEKLAGGDFSVILPGLGRKDEVGEVAGAVEKFKIVSEQRAREEAEAKMRQDQIAAEQRKSEMRRLADSFEGAVGEIVGTVSSASTELEASATTLSSTAERTQQLTTVVAAASEEASTNVQSVASATEELSSSITEISRQVQESARVANEAVGQARTTTERVSELSKAATRIGDVVELINTIAGQTNLLALNATIEAARAGEAGKGFAVVASEVKALAEQTAKATGEIGQQISGIQAATQESVGAIRDISDTIEKLSEISSTIAAAVEEQGAATQEISRNVQQAAHGTQQVSSNITDVQRGAGETGSASSQVLSAAQMLSGDSNRLKLEVGKFLETVRAA
ncbi:HAMP domain-containing methyl-accepting chemotaxis protein [Bradyrhizobium sp. CB1717]|uniref:methyl-accepting chemotaxis protein n=1 Tax=Bradyrhizobium sp. CB1717 TaxID=3039154 RepID=UPI0024B24414|nr:HAMP domain-containing methyl-accepting chemotaxis protein [Bradyrhizobium sp. CB1717]WFU26717.1 HAMP domain-containing methyl-accepting chemotaxis protein [Bradyrhizobium sp. CB1717]